MENLSDLRERGMRSIAWRYTCSSACTECFLENGGYKSHLSSTSLVEITQVVFEMLSSKTK
jgi:hypothetical protein